jgi:hypothetical protein
MTIVQRKTLRLTNKIEPRAGCYKPAFLLKKQVRETALASVKTGPFL